MNRVVHFEIHASDPERAAAFYTNVFGWKIEKWDSPAAEYWMVGTGEGTADSTWPGINGGLLRRRGAQPKDGDAVNAFVCTIDVEDIDDALAKVTGSGGSIALPKNEMPGVGWIAYAKDTEGNLFGMIQNAARS